MSVYKADEAKVKKFEFGQLVPSEEATIENSDSFELKSLRFAQDFKHNITEESIRSEREFEAQSGFKIDHKIKEHRGLKKQEIEDYEKRVSEEVQRRLLSIKEQAYQEGFDQGKKEGEEKAYLEAKEELEIKISEFVEDVEHVKNDVKSIFEKSKNNAYQMVKNLSKWVILKEVDEKYYLARLLEKLIHEINSQLNLTIHVNEESFGYMPEIIKIVERKVGKLTNVRVEVDLDMKENGIKLESENTIIDGSLDAQFASIDRIFSNAGVNE